MVKTKREAQKIGRMARGKPKTYEDAAAAREQRRLAGIRSGESRRAKLAGIAAELARVQRALR